MGFFSRGGNFREEDKSAENAKITPTRKFPRLKYYKYPECNDVSYNFTCPTGKDPGHLGSSEANSLPKPDRYCN